MHCFKMTCHRNNKTIFHLVIVRLLGYTIRISIDSVLPSGQYSCYTDPGNVTPTNIIESKYERTARHILFYHDKSDSKGLFASFLQPNPIIEICEVRVFGRYIVTAVCLKNSIQVLYCHYMYFNYNLTEVFAAGKKKLHVNTINID